MPEYPDIVVYIESLERLVKGATLEQVRLASPFVVRTFDPPITAVSGKRVIALRRMGKRIVFALEDDLFVVIHLMVAGRFQWKQRAGEDSEPVKVPKRSGLASFDFSTGWLLFTEAGTRKRASIHVVRGEEELERFDRGGLEVMETDLDAFTERIQLENHTLKRTLTDPRLFSGIGNAYSDEILLRARLSPLKWSSRLTDEEIVRLRNATLEVLEEWTDLLRDEVGNGFPKKVTAFRKEMAAHGKYKEPCPQCGTPIQRIVYAQNECNYCVECQTGGKLLADRAMSQLLKGDWPKTLQELDERMDRAKP
jgi:formamidopyrimidine-DNA glycosylase